MSMKKSSATIAHEDKNGTYFRGDLSDVLTSHYFDKHTGNVQLILTSPPFPLNTKKKYGNLQGQEYLKWFSNLAPLFSRLLKEDGSLIIEVGNCWEPGRPVQSLLPLQSLLSLVSHETAGLRLVQEFICYNPSRLPTPVEWVTKKRIRTVDSYTHVWWIAKSDYPKADNKKVTRPYSDSMKKLLKSGMYNSGKRPSEHKISETAFLKDCGGSIAHNFLELDPLDSKRQVRLPNAFSFSNTSSNDFFSRKCKELGVSPHPARMPMGLAAFFIEYLTDYGDLVLDPFAGSNTTGYTAARLGRNWLSIDINEEYEAQSRLRFLDPELNSQKGA